MYQVPSWELGRAFAHADSATWITLPFPVSLANSYSTLKTQLRNEQFCNIFSETPQTIPLHYQIWPIPLFPVLLLLVY